MHNKGNTSTQRLLVWVSEQPGGRVHWTAYHKAGIHFGLPAPGQNTPFGSRCPSMVRDGDDRVLTDVGHDRVARYLRGE
jgi:hypothetical protein